MGKKKKFHRRAGSAISPIDKQGVKLSTIMVEAGLAIAVKKTWDHREDLETAGMVLYKNIFDLKYNSAKLFWIGVGTKVAAKYIPELRRMGPVGFR